MAKSRLVTPAKRPTSKRPTPAKKAISKKASPSKLAAISKKASPAKQAKKKYVPPKPCQPSFLLPIGAKEEKPGKFVRLDSAFRNWVSKSNPKFQPESGRYHLYISWACPWANRCEAMRVMKGLTKAISMSVVHPTWAATRPGQDLHHGWIFCKAGQALPNTNGFGANKVSDIQEDTLNGAKSVRDLYEMCEDMVGKYCVPILWDKKLKTIVNNESSEIIQMLNSEFNDFATNPKLDLAPKSAKKAMAAVDPWIYDNINNGVYRCGFATSQESYDTAIATYTKHMQKLDKLLAKSKFVAGNKLTLSDIRLWQTLIRNDEVYTVYFKCDTMTVREYPNIFRYCVDMWQIKGIKETTKMQHIKMHYYTSHPRLNFYGIIPKGPNFIGLLNEAVKKSKHA